MSMNDIRYFYIRNAQKFPVACIASVTIGTLNQGDITLFTWAKWNPIDKFDKKKFREIATGRLNRVLRQGKDFVVGEFGVVLHADRYTSTVFGCALGVIDNQVEISVMLAESPETFELIPYSLRKAAKKQLRRWEEEDDNRLQQARVTVPPAVHERNVSVGNAADRSFRGADSKATGYFHSPSKFYAD